MAGLDVLGRYHVEDVLGGGGMALVYRARDEELDRPVAIKLLADNLAADEAFRKRFLREARLAAQLAHPNVVQVYDSGEADGRPYIVMEYVEGETLADLLSRQGRLPPAEAVELALQVCSGLEHAHQAGLVHRDIKPQNLLIRGDGTVKIVDFGIARSARGTRLTETGSVLGTAAYLAPEQAAGEEVTPAADVYAVGVVLYELLAGRTPRTAESLTQLILTGQEQPIPALRELAPDVPEALEDLIMRCLARIPEYRPPSAGTLAASLSATSGELPTAAVTRDEDTAEAPTRLAAPAGTRVAGAPTSETAVRPVARRPRAAALAIGAVALALAVGGWMALSDDSDPDSGSGSGSSPPAPEVDSSPAEQARDFSAWLRDNSEP
jgi:eukaryotic-like serine/threonine-protein kinase